MTTGIVHGIPYSTTLAPDVTDSATIPRGGVIPWFGHVADQHGGDTDGYATGGGQRDHTSKIRGMLSYMGDDVCSRCGNRMPVIVCFSTRTTTASQTQIGFDSGIYGQKQACPATTSRISVDVNAVISELRQSL